jgi:hypothetical protein
MDHHAQAADQVTIQNIIGSMRMLNNIHWIEFVEGASLVEQILRKGNTTHTTNTTRRTRSALPSLTRLSPYLPLRRPRACVRGHGLCYA